MTASSTDSAPVRTAGRRRDARTDAALIDAVLDLVAEGATLSGLSVVAIAERAGVSRNSLYRRWRTKDALYLDVLASTARPIPPPSGGSLRDDLVELLLPLAERANDPRGSQMMRALSAEARGFPELERRYMTEVVAPRRKALLDAISRGIEAGEIDRLVSPDTATDLLVSPLLVQIWSSRGHDLDPQRITRRIVDAALVGLTPRP